MQNNYYFLKRLSKELDNRIRGFYLSACFSQNKDELIIILADDQENFIIKSFLSSSFCCLSFPSSFHRARKNSIDLFTELLGKQVISSEQFLNERAFSLCFENEYRLVFKMHGNRSNILLYKSGEVISIFNSRHAKDYSLKIDQLHREIDQSKQNYIDQKGDLTNLYPTFGKEILNYLESENLKSIGLEDQWELIQETERMLSKSAFYYSKQRFSLLAFEGAIKSYDTIDAVSSFFVAYTSSRQLESEKSVIVNHLNRRIKKTRSYLTKTKLKLTDIKNKSNYQLYGDLIMANLYQIPKGASTATLISFYDNETTLKIPLKPTLTPQKNAEIFYRKAKNQSLEIESLNKNIGLKEKQLKDLEKELLLVSDFNDLKFLREYVKVNQTHSRDSITVKPKPYHQYQWGDYIIWVGKSAQANDEMLKLTYKEDLWLHAKDVTGSHVILKYSSNNPFTKQAIEKTAQLAAYFSKRKTDSLCPVIFTPKKYVRKRKGDPAGAVVVEKEEVLLVEPEKWI